MTEAVSSILPAPDAGVVQEAVQPTTPQQTFIETLPEEYRTSPLFKNFNGWDDVAKSYASAAKMIGLDKNAVLRIPNEDTPEAWSEIYDKLGRPESAEKYDVNKYVESGVIDKEQLGHFLSELHSVGASQKVVDAAVGYYTKFATESLKASEEATNKQVSEWGQQVKQEFGAAYDQKIAAAKRAVRDLGGQEFMDYVAQVPQVFEHPSVIKMLAKIGEMTGEDSTVFSGGASTNMAMTPNQAKMDIAALQMSPEYQKIVLDKGHPQRQAYLDKMQKLYSYAYPEQG